MRATTASWLPFVNTAVLPGPRLCSSWPRKHDPQTQSATHPELKQTPDSHQGRINQRADVLQGTQTDVCAWKVFNVSSCRVHFSFQLQSLKALRSDKGHKVHQWTVQLWLQCVYLVTLPECTGLWMLLDQPWPRTVSAWLWARKVPRSVSRVYICTTSVPYY